MRKAANKAAVGLLLGGLAACATRAELATIEIGPVVTSPPPSNAGPVDVTRPGGWRKLEVPVKKELVRAAYEQGWSFALLFTNCSDPLIWGSDLYVVGRSLFQSRMPEGEFTKIFAALPETPTLTAYIPEDFYQQQSPICAELGGGNMAGQGVRSDKYVLKSG